MCAKAPDTILRRVQCQHTICVVCAASAGSPTQQQGHNCNIHASVLQNAVHGTGTDESKRRSVEVDRSKEAGEWFSGAALSCYCLELLLSKH